MTRRLRTLCIAAAVAGAAFAAIQSAAKSRVPSPEAIAAHARKNFSLSPLWKVRVSPLKPGAVEGFLAGTLTIEAPQGKQDQPIFVSEDGRWYFMGAPNDLSVDPDREHLSKMKLTGVPAVGPKNAPLTLVEYSDLQCPHCKRSHDILKEKLGPYKGKIRRIFKNYPLRHMHPWALPGAIALACVGEIAPEKAAAFKAGVFAAQDEITLENSNSKFKAIARGTGLPADRFDRCLDKEESKALVLADIEEGDRVGVHGTPSIYVNGRKVRGYEWAEVRAVLDAMLEEKK